MAEVTDTPKPGFRYLYAHESAGWLALSNTADFVLRKMWPANRVYRAKAAAELELTGHTMNGPTFIHDREHANNAQS